MTSEEIRIKELEEKVELLEAKIANDIFDKETKEFYTNQKGMILSYIYKSLQHLIQVVFLGQLHLHRLDFFYHH